MSVDLRLNFDITLSSENQIYQVIKTRVKGLIDITQILFVILIILYIKRMYYTGIIKMFGQFPSTAG